VRVPEDRGLRLDRRGSFGRAYAVGVAAPYPLKYKPQGTRTRWLPEREEEPLFVLVRDELYRHVRLRARSFISTLYPLYKQEWLDPSVSPRQP